MRRAAVTGGAGFVGRRLVNRLVEDGYFVLIIDDLSTGIHPERWIAVDANYTFYKTDARNFFRESSQWQFDLVFHCAAVVGGRLTIEGDPIRVATDLSIDAEMFNWAVRQRNRPKKVIYFSSSAIYPIHLQRKGQYCALAESFVNFSAHKLGMPDQTYGWAKMTGELLAQYAAKKHGVNVVCYRPFSGYSENQALDYPFPAITKRVLDRKNPLVVWGSGEQQRDFIHIDDCVDGVFVTMDKLVPGEALNLGTGIGTSFKALAKLLASLAGRAVEVQNDPTKPEGVYSRVADVYKLHQWFKPKITLEEGIKRALNALDRERKVS